MHRWGFAFSDGKLHMVREPDPYETAVRPRGNALVVFPASGSFMIPFPLDITEEEYEALRWVRKTLDGMPTPPDLQHRVTSLTTPASGPSSGAGLLRGIGPGWRRLERHRTCDLEEGFVPKAIALADTLAAIGRDEQVGRRSRPGHPGVEGVVRRPTGPLGLEM